MVRNRGLRISLSRRFATCLLVMSAVALVCAASARVVVGGEPTFRLGTMLTCGAGRSAAEAFPAAALRSPRGAEDAATPSAGALRRFLGERHFPGHELPRHGYQLLRGTSGVALYGHPPYGAVARAAPRGFYVTARSTHGSWAVSSAGGCWPQILGRKLLVANLRALATRPTPRTRVLEVLVEPPGCAPAPAMAGDKVGWRRRSITLTLLLEQPAGQPVECAGTGRVIGYRVHLSRALGARAVFDGSRIPAARVTAAE